MSFNMGDVNGGWDNFLFLGIPLLGILFFGYFKLDEVFANRKETRRPTPRPAAVPQTTDASMRRDPDGRPWDAPLRTKR